MLSALALSWFSVSLSQSPTGGVRRGALEEEELELGGMQGGFKLVVRTVL